MRILLHRAGAYGDIIHMSHLPRLLKDNGCTYLGVSTNYKGYQILKHNPFIDTFHFFEPGGREITEAYWDGRLRVITQDYDRLIDLTGSLEMGVLCLENQNDYYQHIDVRKKKGEHNYYDVSTKIAGYPELCGKYRGEIFNTKEEIEIVENDLLRDGRFRDNFKVMINISGSGPHKYFVQAKEVAQKILDKYEDAVIFTTGDPSFKDADLSEIGERVHSLVGKKPFRQVALMAKYMDCVIGCESGMMCVASMWDVPTIQLLTATSKYCHCKYSKHDYSIQSPAKCSPCYRGPYKYYGCPKINDSPACVYFDVETIMSKVGDIYEQEYLLSKVAR